MTFDQFWQWQEYVPKTSHECRNVAKQAWEMAAGMDKVDCRRCSYFNTVKQRCICPYTCTNASEYAPLILLQQWRTQDANT